MIDDMTARRFKEKVQKDYVRHVITFPSFLGRSPDTAMSEDLRRFQLHMAQQQISAGSINAAIAALRFFFNVTLERPDLVRHRTTVNKPRKASPLPGMVKAGLVPMRGSKWWSFLFVIVGPSDRE
jgi:site-specific recombinase XerD